MATHPGNPKTFLICQEPVPCSTRPQTCNQPFPVLGRIFIFPAWFHLVLVLLRYPHTLSPFPQTFCT